MAENAVQFSLQKSEYKESVMGNSASGKATDQMRDDRKRVYEAQDTLVRDLVDAPGGSRVEDDDDTHSIDSGNYLLPQIIKILLQSTFMT